MANMYAINGDDLAAIADAIRQKRDIATPIEVADMAMQIGLIEGGGGGIRCISGIVVPDNEDIMSVNNLPFQPVFAICKIKEIDQVYSEAAAAQWLVIPVEMWYNRAGQKTTYLKSRKSGSGNLDHVFDGSGSYYTITANRIDFKRMGTNYPLAVGKEYEYFLYG